MSTNRETNVPIPEVQDADPIPVGNVDPTDRDLNGINPAAEAVLPREQDLVGVNTGAETLALEEAEDKIGKVGGVGEEEEGVDEDEDDGEDDGEDDPDDGDDAEEDETEADEEIPGLEEVMASLPLQQPEDHEAAKANLAAAMAAAAAATPAKRRVVLRDLKAKYPELDIEPLTADLKAAVYLADKSPLDPKLGSITRIRQLRWFIQGVRAETESPKEERHSAMVKAVCLFFEHLAARMFYGPSGPPYVMIDEKTYQVSVNPEFAVFIREISGIDLGGTEGKTVTRGIADYIRQWGSLVEQNQCLLTNLLGGEVFINLNNPRNEILRIFPGGVEVLKNGANPYNVFLLPSNIASIDYCGEVDLAEGMGLLKNLVFANIPCPVPHRYFVLGWGITSILTDFTLNKTILKLSGATDNGKSTAIDIITRMLTGSTQLETSRKVEDLYMLAGQTVIVVLENIEAKDLTRGMTRFLLTCSTGSVRNKRKLFTDSKRVEDRPRAFICVTSIEPFALPELINRTFDVEMDRKRYGNPSFNKTATIQAVARERAKILSAIFRLIGEKVLPRLKERAAEVLDHLSREHKGHFTDRCDETTALVAVVAEALQEQFEGKGNWRKLVDGWVEFQNERGKLNVLEASPVVHSFTILGRELKGGRPEKFKMHYGVNVSTRRGKDGERFLRFESSTRDLLPTLNTICRRFGYSQPFKNAAQLSSRLKNDETSLTQIGWRVRWGIKTVRGTAIHEFRYAVNE